MKNRLFFFADYEGFRSLQRNINFDTVPTVTERQGILASPVYDPRTATSYPANTALPATAITPFARQVIDLLPAPNLPGRSNNYQALLLNRDYYDKYDAKIDGQITTTMTGFLRWSQRKDNQFFQPDLPGIAGGNGNGNVRILDQAAAAGYTWAIAPTSVLEARLGFTHILRWKVSGAAGRAYHAGFVWSHRVADLAGHRGRA